MNGQVTEEEILKANNHMKTYSTSLIMGDELIPPPPNHHHHQDVQVLIACVEYC